MKLIVLRIFVILKVTILLFSLLGVGQTISNESNCFEKMVEWCARSNIIKRNREQRNIKYIFDMIQATCMVDRKGWNCTLSDQPWFSCLKDSKINKFAYKGSMASSEDSDADICQILEWMEKVLANKTKSAKEKSVNKGKDDSLPSEQGQDGKGKHFKNIRTAKMVVSRKEQIFADKLLFKVKDPRDKLLKQSHDAIDETFETNQEGEKEAFKKNYDRVQERLETNQDRRVGLFKKIKNRSENLLKNKSDVRQRLLKKKMFEMENLFKSPKDKKLHLLRIVKREIVHPSLVNHSGDVGRSLLQIRRSRRYTSASELFTKPEKEVEEIMKNAKSDIEKAVTKDKPALKAALDGINQKLKEALKKFKADAEKSLKKSQEKDDVLKKVAEAEKLLDEGFVKMKSKVDETVEGKSLGVLASVRIAKVLSDEAKTFGSSFKGLIEEVKKLLSKSELESPEKAASRNSDKGRAGNSIEENPEASGTGRLQESLDC